MHRRNASAGSFVPEDERGEPSLRNQRRRRTLFQTAFPFGYLIQFLLFVGGALVAFVLIARGWTHRDRALMR
ncbi:MAG TPA: hypothetical protein VFS20_11880, partial [Longimicrobium sp.]|nr:hypothetical protein [Longimicrobium sp.]